MNIAIKYEINQRAIVYKNVVYTLDELINMCESLALLYIVYDNNGNIIKTNY